MGKGGAPAATHDEGRTAHDAEDRTPHDVEDRTPHDAEERTAHDAEDRTPHDTEDRTTHDVEDRTPHDAEDRPAHDAEDRPAHDEPPLPSAPYDPRRRQGSGGHGQAARDPVLDTAQHAAGLLHTTARRGPPAHDRAPRASSTATAARRASSTRPRTAHARAPLRRRRLRAMNGPARLEGVLYPADRAAGAGRGACARSEGDPAACRSYLRKWPARLPGVERMPSVLPSR
ncbi:hypothetical protein HDZ31DRAFT_62368 [Schizophyllum fasciatum]